MTITKNDKIIAWLTLASGLTISAVAVWYSVAGLVSIFAAAAVPIIIMGVALEISKLVATVWLKMNWAIAPKAIKAYLIVAIAILMLITSMGIFGFLSKAHLDQNMVSGEVVDKVAIIDEKIKTQRDNIDAARKALVQMDSAVDQTMARSTSEQGADKAANLRRSQAKERGNLQKDISTAQSAIAKLNEERAPMAKDLRAIEAEVGPIKYIAALIYGSNPDANVLEKAVTWVIIIIVMVFDPLAVVLLLASQFSFMWFRKERENAGLEIFAGTAEIQPVTQDMIDRINDLVKDIEVDLDQPLPEEPKPVDNYAYLHTGKSFYNKPDGWSSVPPQVYQPEEETLFSETTDTELDDQEILEAAHDTEKEAMSAWKHDHPNSSLKLQRRLLEQGLITQLPWEEYLKPKVDVNNNEAAEQLEERPGDYVVKPETYMENIDGHQVKKIIPGYTQNAEQNESTLWQRVQDAKK